MLKGKTKTGFEYSIPDERLDNWEVMELIRGMRDDNALVVDLLKVLLDPEEEKALKEHCKVDGRVRITRMLEEIDEILETEEDEKNQ